MDSAAADPELDSSDQDLDNKIEEFASQESDVNRVPESPPLFSQVDEIDPIIEDVATQLPKSEDGKASSSNLRKGSDVIIDIEFPDEDDEILMSAAKIVDEEETGPSKGEEVEAASTENVQEDDFAFPNPDNVGDLDPEMMEKDEKRRKEVEGFRKFEAMEKIFPDVRCSEYNTVAFVIKQNYMPMDLLEPNPPTCVMKWDPKFVPMPFCSDNVIIIKPKNNQNDGNSENAEEAAGAGPSTTHNVAFKKIRVWNRITEFLPKYPLTSAEDIGFALKLCCVRMNGELRALKYCTEQIMTSDERSNFFSKVVPFMVSLVLQAQEIVTCPLPFLRKNVNHNISLSQKQIACLLANAFFCTFPRRFKSEMEMSSINFKDLFIEEEEIKLKTKAQKIRCLIHYFTRIEAEMPQGVVTYSRKNLRHSNMPEWDKLDKGLTRLIPLIEGTIEDEGSGMLKVDFANCFIGGGALGRGCVQEEILFVIYPELILSRLFSEKLNSNEAVIITGCERFSRYKGYASSFMFDGDYQDTTLYDCQGRRCTQIVAIDALYISRPSFQYNPKTIIRELNKAYVGFASPINQPVAVATGKWGCGAFNGDPQLKAIIQLLAASNAGRDVAFFTFGDITSLNDIIKIIDSIQSMKIKDVWNLLCQYHAICCSSTKPTRSLKQFCLQYAAGRQSQIQQEEQEKQKQSSSRKTKEVPLTHFYSVEKRPLNPLSLDDDNVAALVNGLDKINSPDKPTTESKSVTTGKRQREDEPSALTEVEIQQMLLDEASQGAPTQPTEKAKEHNGLKGGNPKFDSSPKTHKRVRTLLDFYPMSSSGGGT